MAGPNPTAPQLGVAIRELRERRDLTLEDLAGIAHLHTTHLSGIELGKTNPGWEKIRSLADAFEMDASDLIHLAEMLARSGSETDDPDRASKPDEQGRRA